VFVFWRKKREKMNENSNGRGGIGSVESEYIRRHHKHGDLADHQCSSALVKHIKAPVHLVKFSTFFFPVFLLIFYIFVSMCCMYWYVCVCVFSFGFWFLGFLYIGHCFGFKCVLYVKILKVWFFIFGLVLIYDHVSFFSLDDCLLTMELFFSFFVSLINEPLPSTSVWMLRKVRKRGKR